MKDSNAWTKVRIDPRYCSHPNDVAVLVAGIRVALKIARSKEVAPFLEPVEPITDHDHMYWPWAAQYGSEIASKCLLPPASGTAALVPLQWFTEDLDAEDRFGLISLEPIAGLVHRYVANVATRDNADDTSQVENTKTSIVHEITALHEMPQTDTVQMMTRIRTAKIQQLNTKLMGRNERH